MKWAKEKVSTRSEILKKMASLIRKRTEELARAETIDNGKPLRISRAIDIPRSALNFEFFAENISFLNGQFFPMDDLAFNYTLRSPLGVVACISPWNLPLYLLTWKIAPALATGNTVVAKPSEITPMTAFLLGEIAQEAGLPPGVLNIVHGTGEKVGTPLVSHNLIKGISFTGSTQTGKLIAEKSASSFKKVSLEMGGKNPNIIFADCDFEKAVETTLRSSFENQGQICLCGSRIFVEEPIYEKFKKALLEKISTLTVGDPLKEETDLGSIVSASHHNKIKSYIKLAQEEKGRILCGGTEPSLDSSLKDGYFLSPTLVENLSPFCRTNQEEIFGPIATLTPFKTEEEVTEWANSTPYGLAGSLWTKDLDRAHRMARNINSGILWVNCWMVRDLRTPFGGMKQSGLGKEGGLYALKFFTEEKNICIKMN
jgi:aminomuconate-semialdehyde/2-hydroxymuconate-6-semialdehyde dehydrogenase